MSVTVHTTDGLARRATLTTAHGDVATPAFMPVGTRAAVRAIDSADLLAVGAHMVLANTYHLMLRPGAELVAQLGGLHGFMAWDGPTLTDSGGYQVLSLDPKITEAGAEFRSSYDGSLVMLSPEDSVEVQQLLGADVAMVLDVLVGLPAETDTVAAAMEQTLRWSERALAVHNRPNQQLWGIVQGGIDPSLRADSATRTAQLGFEGFGIGGLAVGETPSERNLAIETVCSILPTEACRYVMGLGDPEGVLDAIARGADLFDCVWPTRLARHGKVLTRSGDFNLRRAEHAAVSAPLDESCECTTCVTYSRAYLRHLLMTGELSIHRLLTIHNLTFTFDLLTDARAAIEDGHFDDFHHEVTLRRSK